MLEKKNQPNRKALVIGASMAGLLAARALSDHFDEVVLLEKDTFPPPGKNRKCVPQGKHVHVLLERGRQILEMYLPGLTEELIQLGASDIQDASREVSWFYTGFHKHGKSDVGGIGISRPTLEATVRNRVLSLPNINAVENCKVTGLQTKENSRRIAGLRFVNQLNGDQEETMSADLIVDTCGRGSHTPLWLEKLGYKPPEEEEVKIGIGYTTCFYRRKPNHMPGLKGLVFLATPSNKRMGVILGQDGNRWVVTLGGYPGNHASTDYPEFLKFAKDLPTSDIYDVIRDAEPLTDPVSYKFPANLRRHYEKLTQFPERYLVMGDAVCSFNPVYGQGMTVASMEAVALGECLAEGNKQLARSFFHKVSKIIDDPWNSTVGNDLSFPEVEGPRTLMTRFLNWYISKLHETATQDAKVSIAFLKVINMVAPPPSVLHPGIVWRIFKNHLLPDSGDNAA